MSDTSAQQRPPYSPKSSPFLNEVRRVMRLKHMSRRTEASYLHYIVDFIRFYSKQHPREMGVGEIRAYLSHLAMDKDVAASTQNVALSALLFLYRRVLRVELPNIENIERARRPKRVPVVFTPAEVEAILAQLAGTHHLVISLLYGTGMRLSEMSVLAGEGSRFRVPADHDQRRQGRNGPRNRVTREADSPAQAPAQVGQDIARARPV